MLVPSIAKKEKKPKRPPPAWFLTPPVDRPKEKDWIVEKPIGLYTTPNAISDETHSKLLDYFDSIEWIQRFGEL